MLALSQPREHVTRVSDSTVPTKQHGNPGLAFYESTPVMRVSHWSSMGMMRRVSLIVPPKQDREIPACLGLALRRVSAISLVKHGQDATEILGVTTRDTEM